MARIRQPAVSLTAMGTGSSEAATIQNSLSLDLGSIAPAWADRELTVP
ncbi:MAG: hypothetical protein GY759_03560 [Chloroflexi bacterium]|nr:hypothetical protein [Chloroflexota bacterium]